MRTCSIATIMVKQRKRVIETEKGPETVMETYYFGHSLKDFTASDLLRSNVTAPFIYRTYPLAQ
jgi:hypothetical protein